MDSLLLKKIALKTYEGEIIKVDDALVNVSPTIKRLIDEKGTENVIPLPDISSKTLFKIMEYVKKHAEFDAASMNSMDDKKSIETWDAEYIKVDMDTLYYLILAAYNLKIQKLFDLACDTVADKIRDRTTEEIRRTFNIKSDYTPEEEAINRLRFPWAFESKLVVFKCPHFHSNVDNYD